MFLSFLQYITPVTYPAAGLLGSVGAYSALASDLIFASAKEDNGSEVLEEVAPTPVKALFTDETSKKGLGARVTALIEKMNGDIDTFNQYINDLDDFIVKFRAEKYSVQVKISELEGEKFEITHKKTAMFDDLHQDISRPEALMKKLEDSRDHLDQYLRDKATALADLKANKKELKKQSVALKEMTDEAENLARAIDVYNTDTVWREKNPTLSGTRLLHQMRQLSIAVQMQEQIIADQEAKIADLKIISKQHSTSIKAVKDLIKQYEDKAVNVEKKFHEVLSKDDEIKLHLEILDNSLNSYREQLTFINKMIEKKQTIKASMKKIVNALQASNTEGKDLAEAQANTER